MRIGLAVRPSLPEADAAALDLQQWFTTRGATTVPYAQVLDGASCDLVIVLGGDGTLLQVANQMAPRDIPVIGINFGHVGYLCELDATRILEAAERIVRGDYGVEHRTMVRAIVRRDGRKVCHMDALNEILVGGATRTVTLHVQIDGDPLGMIRGDGVIVATRTGSTAYSFSAGGSILLLDGFVVVASNAVFATSVRSLILPTSSKIHITDHSVATTPYVIADGQRDYQLQKEDVVEIARSPIRGRLVTLGLVTPVRKLSTGFGLRIAQPPDTSPTADALTDTSAKGTKRHRPISPRGRGPHSTK